jgi:hypothetical protein
LATRLVQHDVSEKGHELGRGMARGGFAQHLTGLGVEAGVQGERAVAVVLKAVPLEAPRRERQHWVFPVKCLNVRPFIHAEDRRVGRRAQVQPDDVSGLFFSKSGSFEAM